MVKIRDAISGAPAQCSKRGSNGRKNIVGLVLLVVEKLNLKTVINGGFEYWLNTSKGEQVINRTEILIRKGVTSGKLSSRLTKAVREVSEVLSSYGSVLSSEFDCTAGSSLRMNPVGPREMERIMEYTINIALGKINKEVASEEPQK